MKKYLLLLLLALSVVIMTVPALGVVKTDAARLIPVLEGGRVKPLDTYAREFVTNITGKSSFNGQDPLVTVFGWMTNPDEGAKSEAILCDYLPLRERLGIDPGKKRFSLIQVRDNPKFDALIAETRQKQGNNQTKLDKEAGAFYHRASLISEIFGSELPLIPGQDPHLPWQSPNALAGRTDPDGQRLEQTWHNMLHAFTAGDQAGFDQAAGEFAVVTKRLAGSTMVSETHLNTESMYMKIHPARWAWVFYLLAFLMFLGVSIANKPNLRWTAVTVWYIGFAAHLISLLLRAYISGRAPWSNMYESMQTLAFGIMLFAAAFEIFTKIRIFYASSAVLGVIALVINDASPFDPFVTPLAPVLKSYWLTYHVMIMMLGYSACALAMGIGHMVLGYELWGKGDQQKLQQLDKSLYRVVQVAMLFLIAGIILGAMWANESWGRYWGWDPKETWALITWFYYLAVAHGRFSNWWKRTGTAVLSIVGFPVVLMTYYGVNFFLTGLHSYAGGGAPEPMPPLVWAYLFAELAFLIVYAVLRKKKMQTVVAK